MTPIQAPMASNDISSPPSPRFPPHFPNTNTQVCPYLVQGCLGIFWILDSGSRLSLMFTPIYCFFALSVLPWSPPLSSLVRCNPSIMQPWVVMEIIGTRYSWLIDSTACNKTVCNPLKISIIYTHHTPHLVDLLSTSYLRVRRLRLSSSPSSSVGEVRFSPFPLFNNQGPIFLSSRAS